MRAGFFVLTDVFGCRPKVERTYCTSNQECSLGGEAAPSCSLVGDFTLGTSYGSVPCNLCPSSQPICLVTDSSSASTVGVCTCIQQRTPLQSCSAVDTGLRVVPDAGQMCAVALHTGASSRSVSAMYDWNYLAATPCILISMSNVYCYSVGGYGNLVVGHGVVKTDFNIMSSSGARRLLSEDEDENKDLVLEGILEFRSWNQTSEPCNLLVSAYVDWYRNSTKRMGVVDMHVLGRCVHWRRVGRGIMRSIFTLGNATSNSSGHENEDCCSHAFMSAEDFVSVVSRNKVGICWMLFFFRPQNSLHHMRS
jgi:hypothetical protein